MEETLFSIDENTEKPRRSLFEELKLKVEAILFATDTPLEAGEIRSFLGEIPLSDVRMALRALGREYEKRAYELVEISNKYQLRTRIEFIDLIKKQYGGKARSLTKNALETLSIIAYRQPVTKAQINAIRQLDSSSIVQTLKEKELIYVSGTRKEVGNPLEYKTTEKFLEIFGLKNLSELPSLRSLQMTLDEQKNASDALKSMQETQDEVLPTSEDIGFHESES
jgi:segregation and condensation protein B